MFVLIGKEAVGTVRDTFRRGFFHSPEGAVTAPPQGRTIQHASTPQPRDQGMTYLGRGVREATSDIHPRLRNGVGEEMLDFLEAFP